MINNHADIGKYKNRTGNEVGLLQRSSDIFFISSCTCAVPISRPTFLQAVFYFLKKIFRYFPVFFSLLKEASPKKDE